MRALDTNVLVRFLTGDDQAQSKKVLSLFRAAQGKDERFHVSLLVLLELVWVLESLYRYHREEILSAFGRMLALPILSIESPEIIEAFLAAAVETKIELSDLLIGLAAKAYESEWTWTFDRKAAKESNLFHLID